MKNSILVLILLLSGSCVFGQKIEETDTNIPYAEILEKPANFDSGNVISRMIDGLGYRYYWATEGLTAKELNYEPGNEGQKVSNVLDHIYGLSGTILNAALNKPNIRPMDLSEMTWTEKRKATLKNLYEASLAFRALSQTEIENSKLTFKRGEKESSFDLWHLFNGPLADAIYHTGQIVSFRRTTGNPMNPKVNVFRGKNRE